MARSDISPRPSRRGTRLGAAALAGVVLVGLTGVSGHASTLPVPQPVSIDVAHPTGVTNPALVGFGANHYPLTDPAALAATRPLAPGSIRLDANIESLYDCTTGALNSRRLANLNAQVDGITALGAQPLVILSYMPACLADQSYPFDPRATSFKPPSDPGQWQQVITAVVTALGPVRVADAKTPVTYFEVWNEPDVPVFWQDTVTRFVTDVAVPAGTAVAQVASTSGLPLKFGVCGCFAADPTWFGPLFEGLRAADVPVGFASWHYYTTLGPDGAEPGFPTQLQVVAPLAKHPLNGPEGIPGEVSLIRAMAQTQLGYVPELIIDEWNLSGGGFDLRNDTNEGAAFQAAALAEMAAAGLDRSVVFNGIDKDDVDSNGHPLPPRYGGWGLVDRALQPKPAWYAQWLWHQLGTDRLPTIQDEATGLYTAAARQGSGVQVLLASYVPNHASDRQVALQLSGLSAGAYTPEVFRIDATHPGATTPTETLAQVVSVDGAATLTLDVPAQSVVFMRLVPAA